MTKDKIYTLEDIAKELGISKTTVSRAISGKGRISQATRERVKVFIEEHDYTPNVLARGLAEKKTYNLGFILPIDYEAMEFPFFKQCMNGICQAASENDYDVIIAMVGGEDLTQLQRMVANGKVDGMILSRSIMNSPVERFLKEKGVPFVIIGPSMNQEEPHVDNNNQEASRELVSLLLMKGSRRLALVGGNSRYLVNESRKQGFLEAYQAQGIPVEETLIFSDVDNYMTAKRATEYALEKNADGIVCMDDFITNLVLICLKEKGIPIPEKLKLASLYDSTQLQYSSPAVTALHFEAKALGRNACLKLLETMEEKKTGEFYPLTYQIILRESTK